MATKGCIKKFRFGFLENPLSNLCYKHTLVVASHPWPFLIVPILISCGLGVGYFYRTDTMAAFEVYSPMSGIARGVRDNIRSLFPGRDGSYTPSRSIVYEGQCDLLIVSKDGGNILRSEYRKAVERINEHVMDNVMVMVDGVEYGYKNICLKYMDFCHNNPHLYAVDVMLDAPEAFDNFSWPMVRRGSRRFYLGATLANVTLDPLSAQIVEAKAWHLVYQTRFDGKYVKIVDLWQRQFEKAMLSIKNPLLDVYVFHSQSTDLEIRKNADDITPKFISCIILLLTFAVLCTLSVLWFDGRPYVDWTRSKPTLAIAGLLGAIMGVVTTIGLLVFCGYQYNNVVDAMPFLVLGVRLDNTFLMISAVHHTDRRLKARERVSEAMAEAAVSITITVLTDILSFAVGIFTDFLAVQIFSVYIAVAMTVTYIYQLTFLLAVLVFSVRAEERNSHSVITKYTTVQPTTSKPLSLITRMFNLGSHVDHTLENAVPKKSSTKERRNSTLSESGHSKIDYLEGTWMSKMISTHYAPFLMKNSTRVGVLFLYLLYLAISVYGCYNVRQGLEPTKLMLKDSYATKFAFKMQELFWNKGTQIQVVFNNAGDLTDQQNRNHILNIVHKFADSKHGMGNDGVVFWLKAFKEYLVDNQQPNLDSLTKETFYNSLNLFLSLPEYAEFRNDLHWENGSNVSSFRALVGIKNYHTPSFQIETVNNFRDIADDYPSYQIGVFEFWFLFVDQYQAVLPNTLQEIYGGVSFMILIAIFLIPSMMSSLWVAIAIVSIDAGIIGFMTFWDINLDVISMITIIMSIGFSVDFTAHIAYAFVVFDGKTTVDKTTMALGSLAWPIVQSGIATTMGVMPLADSNSYIQMTFFRTVFIIITLGLLHALVFLPVVLSVFSCKLSTKHFKTCFSDTKPQHAVDMTVVASIDNKHPSPVEVVPVDP